MPCACGFVLLPPPILIGVVVVVVSSIQSVGVFCLFSFVSFFSLLCVCVKKILSRLFFLSLLCLFLVSFLLSSVCQNSFVFFLHQKIKSEETVEKSLSSFFKNFSRHASSSNNFYSIRRPSSFEGGGLFMMSEK